MDDLSDEELQGLYAWIDEIPLSRQKKNINRDFSDAVLAAEVVHHFLPRLVDLHNYTPANSVAMKLDNWRTLNRKVFIKMSYVLVDEVLQGVAASKPGVIEHILQGLRRKIERCLQQEIAIESGQKNSIYDINKFLVPDEAYNTAQLSSNYEQGSILENNQGLIRHPGPATNLTTQESNCLQDSPYPDLNYSSQQDTQGMPTPQLNMGLMIRHNPVVQYNHRPSRLPVPKRPYNDYHHGQNPGGHGGGNGGGGGGGMVSHSLPPINPRQQAQVQRRGYSNHERQKAAKLPSLVKPRNAGHQSEGNANKRESSTGLRIRMAEKDQKILEAKEHIQLLQMKITRLEHLVRIKDMRIEDLARQLESARTTTHLKR